MDRVNVLVKYVLFGTNMVYSMFGVGLVVIGALILVNVKYLLHMLPVTDGMVPILVILLGAVVFSIATAGCCGAVKESKCLLIVYCTCMLVLAGLKSAVVVMLLRYTDNFTTKLDGLMADAFHTKTVSPIFHDLEAALHCCGTYGWRVYVTLPQSCCEHTVPCVQESAYQVGCNIMVRTLVTMYSRPAAGILIGIVVIEVIAMILAASLAKSVKSEPHRI